VPVPISAKVDEGTILRLIVKEAPRGPSKRLNCSCDLCRRRRPHRRREPAEGLGRVAAPATRRVAAAHATVWQGRLASACPKKGLPLGTYPHPLRAHLILAHVKADKAISRRFVPCPRTERSLGSLSRRRLVDARRTDGCQRLTRLPRPRHLLPPPETRISVAMK
jgi:hypothetical protein